MKVQKIRHAALLAAITGGFMLTGIGTSLAGFPDKPITFLVGAGAGGSTSAGARLLARAMEKSLKNPVVVINKPGGGGSKALVLLKKSKKDGYTLAYAFAHHVAFQPYYKRKTPAYTVSQFTYIGSTTVPQQTIVSLANKPWKDLKQMVAHFRKLGKPISLVYSGGPGRLVGEAIGKGMNIKVKIIRVRGGGKSMQRVLGGHVDVVFTAGAHIKYTDAGQTQVIAAVTSERNWDYPKAPTLKELGVNATTNTLQILVAPGGIPTARQKILTKALMKARTDPAVVKLYKKNLRMRMDTRSQKELSKYMLQLEVEYKKLIRDNS